VRTIAPFLSLDHDPYWSSVRADVLDAGRLYDERVFSLRAACARRYNFNYIRNSVKAVIDAYNGTVDFYLIDQADPIAATYRRIFRTIQAVRGHAAGLQKHIRYPEDLFLIQARLYQTYHMQAPDVFYNRGRSLGNSPPAVGDSGTAPMVHTTSSCGCPEKHKLSSLS